MIKKTLILTPVLALFVLSALIPGGADGAAIAIDSMTHTPDEPTIEGSVTVTATVVPVDAHIIEDGVVLVWSMCTETTCDLPYEEIMTYNVVSDIWSATISDMPMTSSNGDPYIEVKFHVKVTATPTDGGTEDITEENEQVTLELKEVQDPFDDDDTAEDDDDDTEDSPLGAGIQTASVVIASLALFILRRRDH